LQIKQLSAVLMREKHKNRLRHPSFSMKDPSLGTFRIAEAAGMQKNFEMKSKNINTTI